MRVAMCLLNMLLTTAFIGCLENSETNSQEELAKSVTGVHSSSESSSSSGNVSSMVSSSNSENLDSLMFWSDIAKAQKQARIFLDSGSANPFPTNAMAFCDLDPQLPLKKMLLKRQERKSYSSLCRYDIELVDTLWIQMRGADTLMQMKRLDPAGYRSLMGCVNGIQVEDMQLWAQVELKCQNSSYPLSLKIHYDLNPQVSKELNDHPFVLYSLNYRGVDLTPRDSSQNPNLHLVNF